MVGGRLWVSERPFLDPCGVMTYDWFHNCLQDGMLTVELQLLLVACEPLGLTKAQVKADLQDPAWSFPSQVRGKARQLHRIFDPYRVCTTDPGRLKCSASELLGVYQLLRWIVATRVARTPEVQPKLESFDAACHVIELVLAIKRQGIAIAVGARELQQALARHLALHIAAYGPDGIRPKHHWNFSIPGQIIRDCIVLDLFIIERTHLAVKVVADEVLNTGRFERSVLAGVLNAEMNAPGASCVHALLGRVCELGPHVHSSSKMRVHGLHLEDGDIVLCGRQCGSIWACLLIDGVLHVAVTILQEQGIHTASWGHWMPSDIQSVWVAAHVHQPVAWKIAGGGALLILR